MRTVFRILLPVLLLFFACENNNEEPEITNTQNNQNLIKRSADPPPTEAEKFENIMQWTSYITAKIVVTNPLAESEFIDALTSDPNSSSPEAKIIALSDLLQPKNGVNTAFKIAFKQQFLHFQENDWYDTDENCGRPKGGAPIPDPTGGCENYCQFEKALIENNCLEFYLPLGYHSNIEIINSSSHPLNTSGENDRFEYPSCEQNLVINSGNLHTLSNVLVIRPYRSANPVNDCSYNEYPFNFTLFLSN